VENNKKSSSMRGIVVTGMHRSGTTFVGEILKRYNNTSLIHEPFNREYGLKGLDSVYACDLNNDHYNFSLLMLNNLLKGNAKYVRKAQGDSFPKAIARFVAGGNTSVDTKRYRFKRLFNQKLMPVIKDPFLVLLTRMLLNNDFGVIIIIRHPAAVWNSLLRMGWKLDVSTLGCSNLFAADSKVSSIPDLQSQSEVVKFCALWRVIYSYVVALGDHPRLYKITHEEICNNPQQFLNQLSNRYRLLPSRSLLPFIDKSMNSHLVSITGNQLHAFNRDSQQLSTAWIGALSENDEMTIRELTGDLVEKIYGSWVPVTANSAM